MNLLSLSTDYALINHCLSGTNMWSAFGSGFTTTTLPITALIDAQGWPNDAAASGQSYGGAFFVPDPTNFGGPYTLDLIGNGAINMNAQIGTATWTASSPVNCSVTFNSGGTLQVTSTGGASTASIQISLTTTGTGPQAIQFKIVSTGTSGFFVKNVRFYRTSDATDLAAGKIWRSAWKQSLVNLCPSAVRFMNILGGNSNRNCRFENRTSPSAAGYSFQMTASPVYSVAGGINQYSCTSAPPTTTSTPLSARRFPKAWT